MRKTLGFILGILLSIPLTLGAGEVYAWSKTSKGRQDLLAEAMRITGRTCQHDQRQSEEDGERGAYCTAPLIIDRDLSYMGAAGMYDPSSNPRVVYVDYKGIAKHNRSVPASERIRPEETIVHEYVHYLQWVNGDLRPRLPVCAIVDLEIEAHKADQEYSTPGKINERTQEIIEGYKINCALSGGQ